MPDNKIFFECKSLERPDVPIVKGVIRMFLQTNGIIGKNPDHEDTIDYCEITSIDLGGSVPARLMNMVLTGETQSDMRAMYAHMLA